MKVYMSNIEQINSFADMEKSLSVLDKVRFDKFASKTRKLQFLLSRKIVKNATGETVKLCENGAPAIKSGYISIAHKDNFVLVAISDSRVGIDIENIAVNRDFFGQSDLLGLPKTNDKKTFYKNFVRYEAEFKFGDNATKAHKYFYEMNNYLICICTEKQNDDIKFVLSDVPAVRFVNAE